jgi:integrase
MEQFKRNTEVVLSCMKNNGYNPEVLRQYERMYQSLSTFLFSNRLAYGKEAYGKWQQSDADGLSNKYHYVMDNCIVKLSDVYDVGTVLPEHMPHRKFILLPQFEDEINEYLNSCKETYLETQQRNIKVRCTGFMRFLQNRGLTDVSVLRYEDILAYHADIPHKERVDRILYESSVKLFLSHLADKGRCSHGLGWFLHYLQSDRIVPADTVADIPCVIPDPEGKKTLLLSVEEYRNLSEDLLSALKDEHLSRNIITVYDNTFKLHFIFLDMNGLKYSSARAIAWVEAAKGVFKSSWPTMRCAMRLFDDYARTGVLVPGKSYTSNPSGSDLLPKWCKTPITEFVGQREKAKMSPSAIHMDITSCVRFCEFLSKEGLVSFNNLTANAVKDFNVQDKHQTAQGKGAYNSRIRRFLKFLARERYVTNASLYQALGGPAASSEHIVITLNEAEKETLKAFNASAKLGLELRDKACILLGTEMGIRGCDIVNLKFSDISWKDRSICFRQEKTRIEVWLAMPVSVGNAVYHYLKDGRPKEAKCDHIFVTAKPPYRKLAPLSCRQALCRALPDRKVEGSGFHVTRKTFATERLRNNVDPDQIANAMGHVTRDSLAPYLSLDDERMGLCPLSIEDLSIRMKGGFGDD